MVHGLLCAEIYVHKDLQEVRTQVTVKDIFMCYEQEGLSFAVGEK